MQLATDPVGIVAGKEQFHPVFTAGYVLLPQDVCELALLPGYGCQELTLFQRKLRKPVFGLCFLFSELGKGTFGRGNGFLGLGKFFGDLVFRFFCPVDFLFERSQLAVQIFLFCLGCLFLLCLVL